MYFVQKANKVLQRMAQKTHRPSHVYVKLLPDGELEHSIVLWSQFPYLGAAITVFDVFMGNLPIVSPRKFAKFSCLVFCGLVLGVDSTAYDRAFHYSDRLL
jgi:hypothetical protein